MFLFSFPAKASTAIAIFSCLFLLAACSEQNSSESIAKKPTTQKNSEAVITTTTQSTSINSKAPLLEIYKSPTCSCCEKWIDHIDQYGFVSKAHNQHDLSAFKSNKGISPQYRSCHTAVSKDGYVFEGHVPAKFIHQFLANPPANTIGLAVPAMPVGTPGMEVGDRFMPYQVILLNTDGSYDIYNDSVPRACHLFT